MTEKKSRSEIAADARGRAARSSIGDGATLTDAQALRRSDRRYHVFFQNAPDCCYIVSPEGLILDANVAAVERLGCARGELIGKPVIGLYAAESAADAAAAVAEWQRTGLVKDRELGFVTGDGQHRTVLLSASAVRDAGGRILYSVLIEKDITERKKEETILRRMATVVRDSNDAITIQDFEGRITAWNRGAELMYGYSEEEALRKNIWLLTPPNKAEEQKDFTRRLIAGEAITSLETQRVTKDGRILDICMTVTKLVDDAGKPICIASTERDITGRKRAEEAARASEAEKALILDNVGDIIAYHDKNMRLVWANQAYLNGIGSIKGTPARMEEVRGLHCCEAWKLTKPCIGCPVSVALRTGETNEAELTPENQPHWPATQGAWSIKASPLHDAQGNVIGAIEISRNITERKKADALLHIKGTAVASAIAGIAISDLDGRISYVNAAWLHMHGHDSDAEVMGTTPSQHVRNPADVEAIVKAIKQEGHWTGELVCRRRDGSHFAAELATNLMMDSTGRPMGMLASFQDITERVRAEEELRVKDRALESSINAVALGGLDGKLTYVNPAFLKLWGYRDRREVEGRSAIEFWVSPDEAAQVMAALQKTGQWSGEMKAANKDGGAIDLELTACMILSADGGPTGMFAAFQDITDRKRADEKVRFFALAVDNSSDAIGMSTPDGKHYYQNKVFNDLFGNVGENPPSTLYVDEQVGREVFRTIMGGNPWTGEVKMRGKAGKLLDVLLRAYAIKDDTQRIVGLVGVHTDITERKKAEEALQESETRLSAISKNIPTGLFIVHKKTRIIYEVNDSALETIGLPRGDVVGKICHRFLCPAEKGSCPICDLGQVVDRSERVLLKTDGTRVPILKTVVPITLKGENYLLESFIDITERKRAEESITRLNRELLHKNAELEQVVYVASHDLRSPLVNVQGFCKELGGSIADLMQRISQADIGEKAAKSIAPIITTDIPESLGYIQTSVARMDSLLSGLLKLSRLGRAATSIVVLDIGEIMSEVLKNFEYTCKQKGAEMRVDGPLPSCRGDQVQTSQVFSNLVDNALKYLDPSRPGKITISGTQEDGNAVYCVADNGIGMAQEHCEKAFEIFHRLDPKFAEGEGLGLTIVRRSLDKQGGRVWAESELGKGSRFLVSLPVGEG